MHAAGAIGTCGKWTQVEANDRSFQPRARLGDDLRDDLLLVDGDLLEGR
jgi:hypothetical protein